MPPQPIYYAGMSTARALVLPIYLPTLLVAISQGMLVPLLPVYAGSFEISYALIGLVLAGEALGKLAFDVPAGALLNRLDHKRSMVLGVLLAGISVVALTWAGSVWELVLYRFVAGIGAALWNLARHAHLTDATRGQGRGQAIALFGGTNRLGSFLGPVAGGLLAAALGIHAAFWLFGALSAMTAIMEMLFVTPSAPGLSRRRAPRHEVWHTLQAHRSVLASAGGAQLLAQMTRAGKKVLIPLFGSDVLQLGVDAIGLILGASSFLDMLMFYPAGLIMDRWGRKFAIVPCFTLQALGLLLVPFSAGATTLFAATALIGLGNGLGAGTMMTLGSDLAPPDAPGAFLGLWRLIGDAGAMGAPLAIGAIAGALSLSLGAVVVAGTGLLAAGIFTFRVPETLERAT